MSNLRAIIVALALFGSTVTAHAQWTVTNLHPSSQWGFSFASGTTGTQQVGTVQVPLGGGSVARYASLWDSTAASWVNLHPNLPNAVRSEAFAIFGTQQVGYTAIEVSVGLVQLNACFWQGSAASFVSLHPETASASYAYGTSGTHQVGWAVPRGGPAGRHASLWNSTAESWVDLHPANTTSSEAFAVAGEQQVGYGVIASFGPHAALWTGTAASFVDLQPRDASLSLAYGTSGTQQVGMVSVFIGPLYNDHAALWSGTVESWVDLHPAGASTSQAVGISGIYQVGDAVVNGVHRASLWTGTAASWVDLGAFAPQGFTDTYAESVWSDASSIYVAGWGLNTITGRNEALLWTNRITPKPCPGDIDNNGVVDVDDMLAVINAWGPCPVGGPPCPADINGSGAIDIDDLLGVIIAWGPCS